MNEEETRKIVRKEYAGIVTKGSSCCGPTGSGTGSDGRAKDVSKIIGYSDEELGDLPEGANLGLGCGNPVALASLKEGDTYLDLGSGAGIDSFLASKKVGKTGKVIGVDMTSEMLDRARENARKGNYDNVDFRLGEIEHLPVTDNTVDVITSNCVINLSPDKKAVFEEAFRVLKPGGKLMISDVVLLKPLPEAVLNSIEAYVGCISGAMIKDEYLQIVKDAGFEEVEVKSEAVFPTENLLDDPLAKSIVEGLKLSTEEVKDIGGTIASIKFQGLKPMKE